MAFRFTDWCAPRYTDQKDLHMVFEWRAFSGNEIRAASAKAPTQRGEVPSTLPVVTVSQIRHPHEVHFMP